MKVVNVEIYSLLFLIILFFDYYNKFRHRFTNSSYKFLNALGCIGFISIINICLETIHLTPSIRYILLIIGFYLIFFLPIIFYEYIEENFLLSKYYFLYKKYIKAFFLIYIPLCIVFVFLKSSAYLETPFSMNMYSNYHLLILLSLGPIVLLFIEYLYYFLKRSNKDIRIFLTIIFCLLGALGQYLFSNYYLLTPIYVIAVFLIYFYKNETLVYNDVLTGLYNREIIEKIQYNRRKNDKALVLYMIDVNKFKQINDTYGHDKGDLVLKDIAKLLLSTVRHTDYVIRFGGDEFIIIADFEDTNDADLIPKKINANLKAYNKGKKIKVSLSIGSEIVNISRNGKYNIYKYLKKADEKMYKEKRKRS